MTPPSRQGLVLAVDLGTSGCKCALVSLEGTVQAWTFRSVALHVDGVSAEQAPEDWWRAFTDGARELLARDAALRTRVVAICCATQGEGTVAVDHRGQPLARALLWLDMRGAAAIARRLRGRGVNLMGYGPRKLWRWWRLTGGAPALSGKDPAGHIAYLKDAHPALYERTYKFLNVLDYMNLRLTGRYCATHDSILTSWITDNRRLRALRYDAQLVRFLGVDAEKLPPIVPCTEVLGPVLPQVALELGLGASVPVVAGAIDNSAVAVGACPVRDFETHLYIGTSSWLGAHVPFKRTDLLTKIASVPCAVTDRYLAMAMQSAAGANLTFLRDHVLSEERAGESDAAAFFERLEPIAARAPAGARGLLYTPWLFGERTPVDDTSLRGGFLNLSLGHGREDIVRAVLEGVALNTRWMLEPFVRFLGRTPLGITAVGGGAQSSLWCQVLADVTGCAIRQPAAPIQAAALGAAFIAGVGVGALRFEDLPHEVSGVRVHEPNPTHRSLYAERFATFRDLHRRLAPLYRRLNAGPGPMP